MTHTQDSRPRHLRVVPDSATESGQKFRSDRRSVPVTYVLHVALQEITPIIWRRLEARSDLLLPDFHLALQSALGWTNSHLHMFEKKQSPGDLRGELYLDQGSIDEGMSGVDEAGVRLDQLLDAPGDTLDYEYDFGDSWQHIITLEAVVELRSGTAAVICVAGARSAPPEDAGGVSGYESLVEALADPGHPEHDSFRTWAGPDFAPDNFSKTATNDRLATWSQRRAAVVPAGLTAALDRLYGPLQDQLWSWIFDAQSADPLTDGVAERLTYPYRWLLERVGTEGIKLTSAGYLPPAHVEAAAAALDFGDEWIGTLNRENQTIPMLELRESAQDLGLLRKAKGHLSVTAAGRKLLTSPLGLAKHIATRLPLGKAAYEQQAGLMALLHFAAGRTPDYPLIAEMLTAQGWRVESGALNEHDSYRAAEHTITVLRRLQVQPNWRGMKTRGITSDARTFAVAALRLSRQTAGTHQP